MSWDLTMYAICGGPCPDPPKRKVYIIGSLRNGQVPEIAKKLRSLMPDVEVFDDWYAAGFEADDMWRTYEKERGRTYEEALQGYAAKHVFEFDKHHLDTCDAAILVLPAGKSGHLELGYVAGRGKWTAILLDGEYDRWDVMLKFSDKVTRDLDDIVDGLKEEWGL
jgi:hypothetical protein